VLKRVFTWRIWALIGFVLQYCFPTLGEREVQWIGVCVLAVGSALYAAVLPPSLTLPPEDTVRYQIMASRYNPAHAALTMDLVAVTAEPAAADSSHGMRVWW
jgi:hypothetical protein